MDRLFCTLLCIPLTIMLTHCSTFSIFNDDHRTEIGMHPVSEAPMALPPGSNNYHHTMPQQHPIPAPVQTESIAAPVASNDMTPNAETATSVPAANAVSAAPTVSFGAMDSVDHTKCSQALQSSRTNDTTSWYNPNTDVAYALTPTDTYKNNEGQTCRKYTLVKSKSGVRRMSVQQACRTADGSWGG
ncbi:MAG: hypothetical protein ACX932_04520 [Gammaproteobacteria bacterium]